MAMEWKVEVWGPNYDTYESDPQTYPTLTAAVRAWEAKGYQVDTVDTIYYQPLFGEGKLTVVPRPESSLPLTIPVIEDLDGKILDVLDSSPGHWLDMGAWHSDSCETTHCRAGWAIVVAGEAGRVLEERCHDTGLAAALLYEAAYPKLPQPIPDFYDDNASAMTNMKYRAQRYLLHDPDYRCEPTTPA